MLSSLSHRGVSCRGLPGRCQGAAFYSGDLPARSESRHSLAGKVPIVLAVPNYATKELNFPLVLEPGEDMEADMRKMIECFASTTPRHPEKLSAPVKAVRINKS